MNVFVAGLPRHCSEQELRTALKHLAVEAVQLHVSVDEVATACEKYDGLKLYDKFLHVSAVRSAPSGCRRCHQFGHSETICTKSPAPRDIPPSISVPKRVLAPVRLNPEKVTDEHEPISSIVFAKEFARDVEEDEWPERMVQDGSRDCMKKEKSAEVVNEVPHSAVVIPSVLFAKEFARGVEEDEWPKRMGQEDSRDCVKKEKNAEVLNEVPHSVIDPSVLFAKEFARDEEDEWPERMVQEDSKNCVKKEERAKVVSEVPHSAVASILFAKELASDAQSDERPEAAAVKEEQTQVLQEVPLPELPLKRKRSDDSTPVNPSPKAGTQLSKAEQTKALLAAIRGSGEGKHHDSNFALEKPTKAPNLSSLVTCEKCGATIMIKSVLAHVLSKAHKQAASR